MTKIEGSKCPKCGQGEYEFNTYCGSFICSHCGDHYRLARCYCGWKSGQWEREQARIREEEAEKLRRYPATYLPPCVGMDQTERCEGCLICEQCDDIARRNEDCAQAIYEYEHDL